MEMKLVRKLTWDFHKKNPGRAWEDLHSVALEAYCRAKKKFDPAIGTAKESTYLYRSIQNSLLTYVKKKKNTDQFLQVCLI